MLYRKGTWHSGEVEVTTTIISSRLCPEQENQLLCNLGSSLQSRFGASLLPRNSGWLLYLCRILKRDEEMKVNLWYVIQTSLGVSCKGHTAYLRHCLKRNLILSNLPKPFGIHIFEARWKTTEYGKRS